MNFKETRNGIFGDAFITKRWCLRLRARGITCPRDVSTVSLYNTAGPRRKRICFPRCTTLGPSRPITIPVVLRASCVPAPAFARQSCGDPGERLRTAHSLLGFRGWAGLPGACGDGTALRPLPWLLFGPLTSE